MARRCLPLAAGVAITLCLLAGASRAQDIRQRLGQAMAAQLATPILAEGVRGDAARLHQRRAVEAALTTVAIQILIEQPGRAMEVGQALALAAPASAAAVVGMLAFSFPSLASALSRGAGLPAPATLAPTPAALEQPTGLAPAMADARQNAELAAASARLIAAIAADPAGLEAAVARAVADRPNDRASVLRPARAAFPGFAPRIDAAAGGPRPAAPLPGRPVADRRVEAPAAKPANASSALEDPLEGINRAVFGFNDAIDVALLRPLAWTYNKLVPDPAILAVRRFFDNLGSPVIFANDVLQGALSDAGTTVARFVVNSTAGVAGLFEVADGLGLPRHSADFGQTLHSYGIGSGPYLMLPLLGPATVRDGIGRIVDTFTDPTQYLLSGAAALGLTGGRVLSKREEFLPLTDELKAASLDYYSAVRSAYHQRRAFSLNRGRAPPANYELDDLFNATQ